MLERRLIQTLHIHTRITREIKQKDCINIVLEKLLSSYVTQIGNMDRQGWKEYNYIIHEIVPD